MSITHLEDWLYSAHSREHSNNYDDIKLAAPKAIVDYLKNQNKKTIRPITVAGTKGKGSTVRLIESGLLALGKSCIAFTSPHVHSINERWRYQGQPLDDETLLMAAEIINHAESQCDCQLTYFERCYCMAVCLSVELDVDFFLCDVGLGGRLDCANALDTQCAVVTALSYDHCAVLGNTLSLIAGEKLAIARADAPLIIGPQSTEAAAAITEHHQANRIATNQLIQVTREHVFDLKLAGDHQQDNANSAYSCLMTLFPDADQAVIRHAFAQVQLAARCQIISRQNKSNKQKIMVDAAHNGESMRACMSCAHDVLQAEFSIIIGCAQDKMLDDICAALPSTTPTDQSPRILRCGYDWSRACGPEDWPAAAQDWPYYQNIEDALAAIDPNKDCCITGSFYLAGEALAVLENSPQPSQQAVLQIPG